MQFSDIAIVTVAISHKPFIYIGVKKRIAAEFEWACAMIEHNLYFKSSAIEKTPIKPHSV